ncbi:MAG TPA: serine/threonine-protein kinase [Polyangiaceae bacterium]|nr:serine/threonine-protein kinase [Polyangiaceae bacterium]
MRDATVYASTLLELHTLAGAAERRAAWRQSMATLARAVAEDGARPLEGLHPEGLVLGVRAALGAGLVDDLDWLAPEAAGAALYELASALPLGPEQRELGRRVLARLMAADAATFVAIAWRMALGAGKGLGSAQVRARVALVTELPISLGVSDGPLAFAIAARRELAREWIGVPSTGSLASRRLAARLIERAAREAARRASYGDEHGLRVFRSDAVSQAWQRLLADRESLVWRHVAAARGLLAPWDPPMAKAMADALSPELTPTEWRRAATSVAAHVAVAPEAALSLARRSLKDGLLERDPGACSAFVWGLARAAEADRDAAAELLDLVMEEAQPEVGEAVVELRAELGESPVVDAAASAALGLLRKRASGGDDGAEALLQEVARDLERGTREDQPLREQIARALAAFASDGAKEAYGLARDALAAAQGSLYALEAVKAAEEDASGKAGTIARRTALAVLRDLDTSLLEREVLASLLALGGGDAARTVADTLDPLRDRLGEWILAREGAPLHSASGGAPAVPKHVTLSLRRLRTLLHLVDGDIGDEETDAPRAARLRKRWTRIARALLDRFENGPASPVRRTVMAALARALDALVRVGACDVVDALLLVSRTVSDPAELSTLAEASMDPDLVHVLRRFARFSMSVEADPASSMPAFDELTREIATDAAGRIDGLRTALVRLGTALETLSSAAALRDLAPAAGGDPEAVASLEATLASVANLAIGARARLAPDGRASVAPPPTRTLTVAVSRVLSGAEPSLSEQAVTDALAQPLASVPRALGALVSAVARRLVGLPVDGKRSTSLTNIRAVEALPAWIPARRTIGGFYVVRGLGSGAVGSVFVVTRVEEKGEETAEKLALKVPEYSASAARSLSEAEFLRMFRDEASALIALPQHPNLARFVTFDAGTKPKPILVMEFVEGVTLERVLETRGLDTPRALRVLEDVLSGLEAMHAVGVGHLDLKPSNVVMRRGEEAVLVDFGLAGRHLRPGCATGPYGAPEVWGAEDASGGSAGNASPAKADIYAFGCIAFELLTGRVLFDAPNEMAQVAMHIVHDGSPEPLQKLAGEAPLAPFAALLSSTLRRNPADRPTATALRKELARISPTISKRPWPIDGDAPAR